MSDETRRELDELMAVIESGKRGEWRQHEAAMTPEKWTKNFRRLEYEEVGDEDDK